MRKLLPFRRIIVIDMTHGGKILAEELKENWEIIGVDIYDTMDPNEIIRFNQIGIEIKKNLEEISLKKSDMIIAPVHCNPNFLSKAIIEKINILSFHKIVGMLLKTELTKKIIIEITGTLGKTTTAITLAKLLSYQYNILCLSSRGLELFQNGNSRCLNNEVEIAPPYLLHVRKYLQDFDIGIFEISLGGTGLADIGILTNIIEDYPIANSSRTASYGKIQLLNLAKENSVILYNSDDENSNKLLKKTDTKAITISFGETGQIQASSHGLLSFNEQTKLEINYDFYYKDLKKGKIKGSISGKLIGPGYFYAILTYIGVALILNMNINKIIENLNKVLEVSNRLSVSRIKNYWIIKNINSGVGHLSLHATLESLSSYITKHNSKMWLIFEANSSVCEGISIEKIIETISRWKSVIHDVYSTDLNVGKSFIDLNKLIVNLGEKARKNDIIFIAKKEKG